MCTLISSVVLWSRSTLNHGRVLVPVQHVPLSLPHCWPSQSGSLGKKVLTGKKVLINSKAVTLKGWLAVEVVSNIWWWGRTTRTGAVDMRATSIVLTCSSSIAPNVVTGITMSNADAVHIWLIDCMMCSDSTLYWKTVCASKLVANDPSTHLAISMTVDRVNFARTTCSRRVRSLACSYPTWNIFHPGRWALLTSIAHVKISCACHSPAPQYNCTCRFSACGCIKSFSRLSKAWNKFSFSLSNLVCKAATAFFVEVRCTNARDILPPISQLPACVKNLCRFLF